MTDRKTIHRIFVLLLVCAALAALLYGCVEGESEQLAEGKRLMQEYLSGRKARLEECHANVLRPDADKLVLSDYVSGTFREGDESCEFAVNVKTGKIYTSEQLPAFTRSCLRLIEARLELPPAACVGGCTLWMDVPAWQEPREEWPDQTTYLGHVLPVGIEDIDACAAQLLTEDSVCLLVELACPREEIKEGRWTLEDLRGLQNTEIILYGIDGDLPTQEDLKDYYSSFSGVRLRLRPENITFSPGA